MIVVFRKGEGRGVKVIYKRIVCVRRNSIRTDTINVNRILQCFWQAEHVINVIVSLISIYLKKGMKAIQWY